MLNAIGSTISFFKIEWHFVLLKLSTFKDLENYAHFIILLHPSIPKGFPLKFIYCNLSFAYIKFPIELAPIEPILFETKLKLLKRL